MQWTSFSSISLWVRIIQTSFVFFLWRRLLFYVILGAWFEYGEDKIKEAM